MSERLTRLLPLVAATAIAIGGVAHVAGAPRAGDAIWAVALAVVLVPLTVSVARSLCAGDLGVDAIALLAMAGALALGELLAGALVALMLSGGNALEAAAAHHAKRELTKLLERVPRIGTPRRRCSCTRAGSS
jgi:cation transport ATPase